jgi:hypothetical protein
MAARAFREWVLQKAVSTATNRWLAQWIEHQTLNLAVTGSTPVPNAAKAARGAPVSAVQQPAGAGKRRSAAGTALIDAGPRGARASRCVTCRRQHKTVPCSAQIPLVRVLDNDKPTPIASRGPGSRNALGEAKSSPWIAQAQAHSAYGCGTDVLLRPQRHFLAPST